MTKQWNLILVAAAFVLSLILPFIFRDNGYIMDLLISIMIWATVAQSWNLMAGVGGMWSLGHIAFFGFGAYTTAFFSSWGVPTILGFPAGALVSMVIAFVLGFFIVRLSGHYFTLVSFVFAIGMGVLFRYYDEYTGGDYGIIVPMYLEPAGLVNLAWNNQMAYYFLAWFITVLTTVLIYLIVRSSFGYQLAAIREDQRASRAVGINVFQIRLATFVIAAGIASLAGTVYVMYYKLIEPNAAFGFATALNPVIFGIAGGVNHLFGGLVGATLLVPLGSFLNKFSATLPGLDRVVYGVILMLLILFLPKGIMGLIKKRK